MKYALSNPRIPRKLREATFPEKMWTQVSRILETAPSHLRKTKEGQYYLSVNLFPTDESAFLSLYAVQRWAASGKPVFRLEHDLATALAYTEPPSRTFDLIPKLPADGMWVTVPPLFKIPSFTGGWHEVEGFYICEILPEFMNNGKPGIFVLARGKELSEEILVTDVGAVRDDALLYFFLYEGGPLYHQLANDDDEYLMRGVHTLARVVYNLLYILQNTNRIQVIVDPPTGIKALSIDRKDRKEQEKEVEKNRSYISHVTWLLSSPKKVKVISPKVEIETEEEQPKRKVRGTIVLGHIHHYWVSDPKDDKVIEQREFITPKTQRKVTRYLVAKWLLPYRRGEIAEDYKKFVTVLNPNE